jgi:hypothetical protein
MNFDDDGPSTNDDTPATSFHRPSTNEVGCQFIPSSTSPVVIKKAKKLTIPQFDPTKMTWSSFAMKLHASLIECDMAYLLCEPATDTHNAHHSKELMLELFKILQGSA